LIKEGTHYYIAQKFEDFWYQLDPIQKCPNFINDAIKFWSNLAKIPEIYIDIYEVIPFSSNSSVQINVTKNVTHSGNS
jgi:hypothetical protein